MLDKRRCESETWTAGAVLLISRERQHLLLLLLPLVPFAAAAASSSSGDDTVTHTHTHTVSAVTEIQYISIYMYILSNPAAKGGTE